MLETDLNMRQCSSDINAKSSQNKDCYLYNKGRQIDTAVIFDLIGSKCCSLMVNNNHARDILHLGAAE